MAGSIPRVPAQVVEEIVLGVMEKVLVPEGGDKLGVSAAPDPAQLRAALRRVELSSRSILLHLDPSCLNVDDPSDCINVIGPRLGRGSTIELDRDNIVANVPTQIQVRRGMYQITKLGAEPVTLLPQPDQALVKAVARAHSWLQLILDGKVHSIQRLALEAKVDAGYLRRVLRLAFLSPALTAAILDGRQLERLSTDHLRLDVSRPWRLQVTQVS